MTKTTAKGALNIVRTVDSFTTVKGTTFNSYYSGHDDKHRNRDTAFTSYSSAGNPTCGFYQTFSQVTEHRGPLVATLVSVAVGAGPWGGRKTETQMRPSGVLTTYWNQNIDKDSDAKFVFKALTLSMEKQFLYADTHGDAGKFVLVVAFSHFTEWRGFTFEGTGCTKTTPKSCDYAALILNTGSTNLQLVTHYPISNTSLSALTLLI